MKSLLNAIPSISSEKSDLISMPFSVNLHFEVRTAKFSRLLNFGQFNDFPRASRL